VARDPLDRLGRNVLRIRTERGLTQEQVADAGGLALSDVGRIERGQRDPGVRVLMRLARGLGANVADLLAGID
jgi:XRE family transcriptional regulator, fatty acid utilization regulator